MKTAVAWGSFSCACCKEQKSTTEKHHTLATEDWICDECKPNYKACGDCGLLIPAKAKNGLCPDCKEW